MGKKSISKRFESIRNIKSRDELGGKSRMIRENSENTWIQKNSWTPSGANNGHINFDNDQT